MTRYDIINRIIESKGYKNYLEIGVRDGECFKEICCENKTGVDPAPTSSDTTHIMTSDSFFSSLEPEQFFTYILTTGNSVSYQINITVSIFWNNFQWRIFI